MEDKAIKINTSNVLPDDAFEDVVKEKQPAGTSYDRGLWYDICRSFKENKVALVCLIILIIIAIASLLAPLSPYDPEQSMQPRSFCLHPKNIGLAPMILAGIILQELSMEDVFR